MPAPVAPGAEQHPAAAQRELLHHGLDGGAIGDQVDLVQQHQLAAPAERRVVGGELAADHLVLRDEVARGIEQRCAVEQVDEQARALDVAQEAVAEPDAVARALDQAGDVRHHEAALVEGDHAEVREERGERVVGDARARGGDAAQQRGLAGVGQTDQPDVREQLEREAHAPRPAGLARRGVVGRLPGRRREARVAAAAAPAVRGHVALAGRGQVGEQGRVVRRVGVPQHGADGHAHHRVLAVGAGALVAAAGAAALGADLGLVLLVAQRRESGVGQEHDVAALAAVAAGRSAARHVLLPPPRHAAVAAGARSDGDHGLVDELLAHRAPGAGA